MQDDMRRRDAMRRVQTSIDLLEKRMQVDSGDMEYESHLRQKKQLQRVLDRMKAREKPQAR
ncbi:hypothetical protein [Mitsuokella sp. oral taxon 131]|uniref:hypothetical protein n=1 Tax=Mitsuokella sp. oral taxon 131 TaxID=1321780 RepID=UPI0003AE6CCA|nr:hypothetical protein [Mitsuokella sp. oral taxon 131]ERL25393.1 hypothetical protein HMPREF1985_00119 [Mitsuokella sp. oral taxon 131 str. W9106]